MWKMLTVVVPVALLLVAFPAQSQTKWTKYAGNPVMSRGASGAWDDFVVIPNRVILVQDTLKMWYSGSRTGATFNIGYAWSTNGGITWTRHPSNPIVTPTQSWEGPNVSWPYVIFTGSQYKMWYLGHYDIGYATSPDGIVWTKYAGNPVVHHGPSVWDQSSVSWPCVLGPDSVGGFKMWFEGWNAGGVSQIGYATASNETTWTKADGVNPVLGPVPGTWEPSNLRGPRVMFNGQTYQMWYTGGADVRGRGVGYATLSDQGNWVKDSSNPVLAPGPPGSWDAVNVTLGDVLFDGTTYHMWYTGSAGTFTEIGYASAPVDTLLGGVRTERGDIPDAFALEQNYPNPFNPTTVVGYQLSVASNVRLVVYDILGREVATLVNERKAPGSYEITFDGAGLSSGVYFYRLVAGSFVRTKKMLLLR